MIKLGVRLSKEGIPVPINAATGEDITGLLRCTLDSQVATDTKGAPRPINGCDLVKMTLTVYVYNRVGEPVFGVVEQQEAHPSDQLFVPPSLTDKQREQIKRHIERMQTDVGSWRYGPPQSTDDGLTSNQTTGQTPTQDAPADP